MQEAKGQNPYQHTAHDRFLQQFKKSLDSQHQIQPKKALEGESPCLTPTQIQSLVSKLLLNVEIIKGFSMPVWKFQRTFQKLLVIKEQEQCGLRKLDASHRHTHIKAKGSSAAEDIESDPSYVRQVLEKVQAGIALPETEKSVSYFLDLDFAIRSLSMTREADIVLKDMLNSKLVIKILKKQPYRKIEDVKAELTDRLNKKFYNPDEEGPLGNRFMLISVGENELMVDITTYQNLRREHIHSPDRIQISYNVIPIKKEDGSKTIVLTHQAFQSHIKNYLVQDQPFIRPDLSLLDLAQTLLDRRARLVHFPSIETMDISGWFKLMQYYVGGYRAADDESVLLAIAARPGSEMYFEQTLFRFCRNHFQGDETGIYFYLLNCLLCLNRHGFETHANIIRSFKPEWFGAEVEESLKLSKMLSSLGLLMLSTEWHQGDGLNVEFTFTSGKPALRWTYRVEKRSYSFIMFFHPRHCLNDFVQLFQESQTPFLGLMRGRKTKQDLSLLTTLLKYLKVNETDILRLIESLGDVSNPEVAKIVPFWIPIAQQLRELPKFNAIGDILNFVREFLPTVVRPDLQKANRTFVVELLNRGLSAEDPMEVMRMLLDVDQWKTNFPWIFERNECKSFQKLCLRRIVNLIKTSNQKVSSVIALSGQVQSESLRELAAPFFNSLAEHYLSTSENAMATLKFLKMIREWSVANPWIFTEDSFRSLESKIQSRFENQLLKSTIGEVEYMFSRILSIELQKEVAQSFLRVGAHFLQSSENHDGLVACLVKHPWIYEGNLEIAYPFIENLLKACAPTTERTALAQAFIGFYLKTGKEHGRIHELLTLVKFGELSPDIKKAVGVIYRPLIKQLYHKNAYGEIIRLYRWLGITNATTVVQFKAVLPDSLNEAFKIELRKFLITTFDTHAGSQTDPKVVYKNLVNTCEWHKEFPWLFETTERFTLFQKSVCEKIEKALLLNASNAIVSLKEMLAVVVNPEDQKVFSPHARSVISHCLIASEQQLIWNLISINLCLESYPWICPDESVKHALLKQIVVIIGRALDDPKHDHRWYHLADVYLRSLLSASAPSVEAVSILLKPCMRTHTPSKELVELLEAKADVIIDDLSEVNQHRDVIEFEVFLELVQVRKQRSPASQQFILYAYKEVDAAEYNTDRFLSFKRFLKEKSLTENEAVKTTTVQIVKNLLARLKETEVFSVLEVVKRGLPQTYEVGAKLFYNHMANKKITKSDLNFCRTLLLDEEWSSIRHCDAAVTERFRDTVFDVCVETHFTEFTPYEGFCLIKAASQPNYNRLLSLFQYFDTVKQRQHIKEMWEYFSGIEVPTVEKSVYIKAWIHGLRRAFGAGVVPVKSIGVRYEPVRSIVESLVESDISLEVHLGLFRMLSQAPSEVNCWPLVHYITSRYRKFPKDMEFDMYRLFVYSPQIEEYSQACKGILRLLIEAEVSKAVPNAEVITVAIECLKQSKRFKATPEALKNTSYTDAMKSILDIYRRLEKLKPCPVSTWDEVYNSFVEAEYQPLIHVVLAYLHEKLKPVDTKDHIVVFPHFHCQLEPSALMFLFEYLLGTSALITSYRILPRRIIGHPTTAAILKDLVKIEHWLREILYRCEGPLMLLNTVEDYQTEIKDILLYVNAPAGVATNPVIRSLYIQLIGTLANSKSPFGASQVQALYLHCAIGRTPYEKKYQMVALKLEMTNKLFANQTYRWINPKAPYRELESWRLDFIEFQAKLIEQLVNQLMMHGTLDDEQEMGNYLGSLIEIQMNSLIDVLKITNVPPELSANVAERLKRFVLTLLMLPKSRVREIEVLNKIPRLLEKELSVLHKHFSLFDIIKTLQVHLARDYSSNEVPHRFDLSLSLPERWINLSQLTIAYTSTQYPSRDIAYLLRLLTRLLKKETGVQIELLAGIFESVFTYLIKGSGALRGSAAETLDQLDIFFEKVVNLCIENLNRVESYNVEHDQMRAFILNNILPAYAKLAHIYFSTNRKQFKPALAAMKILSLLNPVLRKDQCEVVWYFGYLNKFTEFVLQELALCYQFSAFQVAETMVLSLAELLMMRGWTLKSYQIKERNDVFKKFIMGLRDVLFGVNQEFTKQLIQKLYCFMQNNHVLDSFDSESKNKLKELASS